MRLQFKEDLRDRASRRKQSQKGRERTTSHTATSKKDIFEFEGCLTQGAFIFDADDAALQLVEWRREDNRRAKAGGSRRNARKIKIITQFMK